MDWFWSDFAYTEPNLLFQDYETVKYNRLRHQMDSIFICERFILILEIKNIAGEIYYDDATNQLLRTYNNQKLQIGDPFS